jgi:hypothetical protein
MFSSLHSLIFFILYWPLITTYDVQESYIIFPCISLNIYRIKNMFQMKVVDANAAYTLYHESIFPTMSNFLRNRKTLISASCKVGVMLDRYEPKLNSSGHGCKL